MFNLGFPETIVILGAALLVFGPKRLPELAKSLGKGIRDFKKAVNGEDENQTPPTTLIPPEHTASRPAPHKSPADTTAVEPNKDGDSDPSSKT
jgi:sec-independent protein translocase protein TatA